MHLSNFVAIASLLCWAVALPGSSSSLAAAQEQSYQALRRFVAKQSLVSRDTTKFENHTSIAKSFDGAALFSGTVEYETAGGVETTTSLSVVCTTCYVTADITAQLRIVDQFNVSAGIEDIVRNVTNDIKNITESIIADVKEAFQNDVAAIAGLQFDNVTWPTVDVDLALDTLDQALPEVQFAVTLDSFDFYVALHTVLDASASYQLNLFTSQSQFGLRVDEDTEIGVFLTVDLLMSADGAVDMDNGFHVQIDDGLTFAIDLFSDDMASVEVDGGHFEFLPITVSSEVALNAILRIGIHAGVGLSTDSLVDVSSPFDYSAGIDTVVFVDIANITTIVTANSNGTAGTDAGIEDVCDGPFAAAAMFELGVGAGVGASVVIADDYSWGIGPTALLPIYYTTVGACPSGSPAAAAAVTTTAAAAPARRADDDLVTTTLSTTATYTAVACKSTGLVNCPVSLQTTLKRSEEISTVLTVASDDVSDLTWPATTATADISTKPFGKAASSMLLSVSGSPTLYTPPATTGSDGATSTPGAPGTTTVLGHTIDNKTRNIAIGVGVGVGVPVIALVLTGIVICAKKRSVKAKDSFDQSSE